MPDRIHPPNRQHRPRTEPYTLSVSDLAKGLMREMADKLESIRPGETITTIGRHALLQATTMDPPLLRALRALAPEIDGAVVRRDYAAQLRQIAGDA
ncbi:hypothetical protein [Streptomyces sp. CRN 30]|uniref:hypothetical protein n=1 Tax=Streptomyces sp. CRN 30 TaxID=3075613 RepID=UPI002A8030EF|nr:hypothetical protein [Streptomyces sp. CRN 30]